MARDSRRMGIGVRFAGGLLLTAGLLAQTGCGHSRPSHFFTLDSTAVRLPAPQNPAAGLVVGFSSITVPEYLQRAQIVLRVTEHRLELSPHARWAERLDDAIPRYIRLALESRPEISRVEIPPSRHSFGPNRLVGLDLVRFDGAPGGEVVLLARFTIHDEEGLRGPAWIDLRVETEDESMDAMVKAMAEALDQLCDEIANALLGDS